MRLSRFSRTVLLSFIFIIPVFTPGFLLAFDVKEIFTDDGLFAMDTINFTLHREHHERYVNKDGKRLPGSVSGMAQGVRAYIDSDYFANNIAGIGLSVYGSYNLLSDSAHFGTGLLKDVALADINARGNVYAQARPSSYTKLGQLYAKWRVGEPGAGSIGYAGLVAMDTPLLNDVTSSSDMNARNTHSSTQGIYGELRGPFDFDVYVAFSDRASGITDLGYYRYGYLDKASGKEQNWIIGLIGARYTVNLPKYDLGYGQIDFETSAAKARDYLQQSYVNLRYSLTCGIFNWVFESHVYLGNSVGSIYDKPYADEFGTNLPPYDSKLWDFSIQLFFKHVRWFAIYQEVNGPRYDYRWDTYADREVDSTTPRVANYVQYLDFTRKNERSWQLRNDLKLAKWGLDKWFMSNSYSKGRFREIGKVKKSHEWERDLELVYEFDGNLTGLTGRFRYASARSYISSGNIDEGRLVFEYSKRFY